MPRNIDVDQKDLKELEKDLMVFASKVYPLITRDTLNNAAFNTMRRGRAIVKNKMITRNKFTERSIQFTKAKGMNVRRQVSSAGSTQFYMEDQEFGATIPKTGSKGVSIPTAIASAEGQGTRPRRKVVRKWNRRTRIKLLKVGTKAKSRRQFIVATIKSAAKRGGARRFVYLPFTRHPGIYWITGGKGKARIRQVYDFSKKSVTIPATPWLRPASKRGQRTMPSFYRKSAKFYLKKAGIFK